MAKMNKSEAVKAAGEQARKSAAVNALTVADLNEMPDYSARIAVAKRYALDEIDSNVIDTLPKYQDIVAAAFVDAAMAVWSNKVRQVKNARESFKRACEGITQEQATAKIRKLLTSMNIRGARINTAAGSMEVYRGDRDGATLYYRFDRADRAAVNPDDANHHAYTYTLRVEISTCGTSYSPARMALVHKIHGELLDAAYEIEATMQRERIIFVYGGQPEPADMDDCAREVGTEPSTAESVVEQ